MTLFYYLFYFAFKNCIINIIGIIKRKYEATSNNKKTKLISSEAMTTIKMKLTTILVQSELTTSFQHCLCSTVDNLTRVQFLASHLLNYHLLRLIEEELNLPEFDLSFFQKFAI